MKNSNIPLSRYEQMLRAEEECDSITAGRRAKFYSPAFRAAMEALKPVHKTEAEPLREPLVSK